MFKNLRLLVSRCFLKTGCRIKRKKYVYIFFSSKWRARRILKRSCFVSYRVAITLFSLILHSFPFAASRWHALTRYCVLVMREHAVSWPTNTCRPEFSFIAPIGPILERYAIFLAQLDQLRVTNFLVISFRFSCWR